MVADSSGARKSARPRQAFVSTVITDRTVAYYLQSTKLTSATPQTAARAACLAPPLVAEASSVFAAFDKDGDGKVSAAELRASMTAALGEEVSEEEAAAILATVDADGDGLLDQEEFSRLGAAGDGGSAGDDDEEVRRRCLKEAFAMYATEGGATITPASLRRMLGKLLLGSEKMGLEECSAMICRFDLNGDGVLSFDEFRVMMMANL